MLYLILIVSVIGYAILINFMLILLKEVQRVHKILWKVAQNESLDFFFENSNKDTKKPVNRD